MVVFPRLIASERRYDQLGGGKGGKTALSGVPALDELLGGGINYGSSTLIMGPAGSGKSTIAAQYALAACRRGEHAACYLFEEGRNSYLERASGLGMDLKKCLAEGRLTVHQIDPAQITPGEFADRVRGEVTRENSSVVVIDSLNGYLNAMPNQKFLQVQIHELLTYLNDHGVLTFLLIAQHGLVGTTESPVDISYLADSVILLRYFEAKGAVRKAISVVKKRSGRHEETIRKFHISSRGLDLGPALEEFRGVLTGTPIFTGSDLEPSPHEPSRNR